MILSHAPNIKITQRRPPYSLLWFNELGWSSWLGLQCTVGDPSLTAELTPHSSFPARVARWKIRHSGICSSQLKKAPKLPCCPCPRRPQQTQWPLSQHAVQNQVSRSRPAEQPVKFFTQGSFWETEGRFTWPGVTLFPTTAHLLPVPTASYLMRRQSSQQLI